MGSWGIKVGVMEINNFVYGDVGRIFVNTDMGCKANCQYCYLPALDIVHGERKISACQAIEIVENLEYYIAGKKGSIISIGCYSECMDENNIIDTIELVKHFIKRDNFVQLATKKKIEKIFFDEIIQCANVERRLWIYVSLPVITNYHFIEIGTDSPYERIKNFDACKRYKINSALYIKPYLEGITNQDITQYSKLVSRYDIPAVVGEMLTTRGITNVALVGEKRLFESKTEGMDEFIHQLQKETRVFAHSIDCIKQ